MPLTTAEIAAIAAMAMPDTRPTYVQKIDAERKALKAERDVLLSGIAELRSYLNSPKFRGLAAMDADRHNLVNVDDVLLRLNETTSAAILASDLTR